MTVAVLLGLAVILLPDPAAACATCVASAYGDRTFNWAYLGLMLTPFAVALTIGGVLAWCHFRPSPSTRAVLDKETT